MESSVDRHQAEAYYIFDLARKLYASGDQEADLAVIDNKDDTIISMSKMIVNMMELLKVENLKPATIKRAYALREAGPDKNMKRILPKAIRQITEAIRDKGPSPYYRRHSESKSTEAPPSQVSSSRPAWHPDVPVIDIIDENNTTKQPYCARGLFARNMRAQAAPINSATKTSATPPAKTADWKGWAEACEAVNKRFTEDMTKETTEKQIHGPEMVADLIDLFEPDESTETSEGSGAAMLEYIQMD